MVVLQKWLLPTQEATPVVAPSRRNRRLNMANPDFYQFEPPQVKEEQEMPEFVSPPMTGNILQEHLERLKQRAAPPELQPGARVRNPSVGDNLQESLQKYYAQLGSVESIGSQLTAAAAARAQHKKMANLQSVLGQQVPGFNMPTLDTHYGAHGKDTPGDPRLQPHVRAARQIIKDRFGISNIGGHATSGHIKGSDHYTGKALDVMGGKQNVADFAIANAANLGVTYVIYNHRIYDTRNGKGWQPYRGSNPHTGHVHISFR